MGESRGHRPPDGEGVEPDEPVPVVPEAPEPEALIAEDVAPAGPGLQRFETFNVETHNAVTRRAIAYVVLGLLALLYLGGIAAWIFHLLPSDDADRLILAVGGVQTLAAAIVGYYFGKGD